MQPFKRTRLKIELPLRFLIGGAAQLRRIIDRIRAKRRQRLFFRDLRRRRRADRAGEGGQPDALRFGSASTTLYAPGGHSRAAAVAAAASSICTQVHTP
jgi:hypothetical protein